MAQATPPTTEKYLNILLFDSEHAAERLRESSIFFFPLNFRKAKDDEGHSMAELIEDNLGDSLEILESELPLTSLVPRDWNRTDKNTRIVSLEGEIYEWGYNLNDGKIIYSSFWDYYATEELVSRPNKFSGFREWWVAQVTNWLTENGFKEGVDYVHSSDQPGAYLEKFRLTIPTSAVSDSITGEVSTSPA